MPRRSWTPPAIPNSRALLAAVPDVGGAGAPR